MSKIELSGSIETFDRASGGPDADAGIRARSNRCSGEPDEAVDGKVNAHLGNPSSGKIVHSDPNCSRK